MRERAICGGAWVLLGCCLGTDWAPLWELLGRRPGAAWALLGCCLGTAWVLSRSCLGAAWVLLGCCLDVAW
eukprot:8431695-Lingulodinium_polyedra.AAC.1